MEKEGNFVSENHQQGYYLQSNLCFGAPDSPNRVHPLHNNYYKSKFETRLTITRIVELKSEKRKMMNSETIKVEGHIPGVRVIYPA